MYSTKESKDKDFLDQELISGEQFHMTQFLHSGGKTYEEQALDFKSVGLDLVEESHAILICAYAVKMAKLAGVNLKLGEEPHLETHGKRVKSSLQEVDLGYCADLLARLASDSRTNGGLLCLSKDGCFGRFQASHNMSYPHYHALGGPSLKT